MKISLRSVEPISMPHIDRDDAMDFLKHFGRETFEFPVQPGCVFLHTLKNAYPRHSFAEGWLLSLMGEKLFALGNGGNDVAELQEYILGSLYLEVGGTFIVPQVSATARGGGPSQPVSTPKVEVDRPVADESWRPVEEMNDNTIKLDCLNIIGTFVMLATMEKREDAYEFFKEFTQLYSDAATAQSHLTDIVIRPQDRGTEIDVLEREGMLVSTGENRYQMTSLGLSGVYGLLGHFHYRYEVYDEAAWCYGQAYGLDSAGTDLLEHQAKCYMALGEWELARIQYEKFLAHHPDALEARARLWMANLAAYQQSHAEGDHHRLQQSRQEMIDACHRVLETDPDNEWALGLLEDAQQN